jgi:hypothetical protein
MSGAASAIRLKILSTDLPDGANQNPLFPQNNPLRDYPKSPLKLRPSRPTQEGRFASVTKRGAGCGGRGSVGRANVVAGRAGFQPVSEGTARRRPMLKRTAKSCGPGTRGWCHVSRRMRRPDRVRRHPSIRRQRWLKEFAHRGDHEVRRKPTAQGRPDALRWTCMLVCAFFCAYCTRDRGCSAHPASPAPSVFSGVKDQAKLGRNAPRDRGRIPSCHRPRRRTTQYSRDAHD